MEDKAVAFQKKLLSSTFAREPDLSAFLRYANECDRREALANFRAYLSILREWDQKGRRAQGWPK